MTGGFLDEDDHMYMVGQLKDATRSMLCSDQTCRQLSQVMNDNVDYELDYHSRKYKLTPNKTLQACSSHSHEPSQPGNESASDKSLRIAGRLCGTGSSI